MIKYLFSRNQLMWSSTKQLVTLLIQKPAFEFLIILTGSMIMISSLLLYWVERPENPHLIDFLDAIYFSVSLITTVGLGDISPVTTSGKIITTIMMLIGATVFVAFTGLISAVVLEIDLRNKK